MPLFITAEELDRCSHDAYLIAEKADSFIKNLQCELETVRAQAIASSITAEQTCALLEQKYLSVTSEFSELESKNAQLSTTLEQKLSELAEAQAEKHQLHLKEINKDGDFERLSCEASELRKSKRQLVELLEQKDIEIGEKKVTIKSYLDKIANLTEDTALKAARLHDHEAEFARLRSGSARLLQEKELIEKHNAWLNGELTAKVNSLAELRRTQTEFEADMSAKLDDVERQFNECSNSLKWHKERVRELEMKLASLHEELCSTKDAAAANEERYSAEKSTVSKLVDLYKESAEEWSRKAGELEGVIKALEAHLNQVENDYKEKLEKEASAKKDLEKEASELKEKLGKFEVEAENARKTDTSSLLPLSSLLSSSSAQELWITESEFGNKEEDSRMLVPKVPLGVSETALAAYLLRNGWSLAKMYEKYQEAVDALRHEQLGRKHSQAILERVMYEIEEKVAVIVDERAEHERMIEAYNSMSQNLQEALSDSAKLENIIRELKLDLRRHEREYDVAQKEIIDLQKQVTVLLKECRDIQVRCGVASQVCPDDSPTSSVVEMEDGTALKQLTFKDIKGLVEQNVQLQSLVHSLSIKNEQIEADLKEKFEKDLQKHIDEASSRVVSVLERSEEQRQMVESLHNSVAMYKRLYEEGLKSCSTYPHSLEASPGDGKKDLMLLPEGSKEATKKALEQSVEHVKKLEEELAKARSEVSALRSDRDKLAMEANFARERLNSFVKDFEHQRDEINGLRARNVELSQLIGDYQRRIRESADSLSASEELSQKLTIEVSVLKHERDILINSEKRASDEVHILSERVHHLQANLETIHSTDEVREEARAMEMRKHEEYLKTVERELAEAKKELREERDHVRTLTLDHEETLKNTLRKGEEAAKELGDALRAFAASEARAAISEARCSELEGKLKSYCKKTIEDDGNKHSVCSANEVIEDLRKADEEILKLKDEAQANKDHMLQYKEIAQVNEAALKQIESAHERFKAEADKLKKSLETEIHSLRSRVSELESDVVSKSTEAASSVVEKEESLSSAFAEMKRLSEDNSAKIAQIAAMEVQISSLNEDLEKEHQRWRTSQNNYERQVILQSETIQELTRTSQALALLQDETLALRKLADTRKSENDLLKATWEAEKSILQELKDGAEKKYNEVNDQNKILLNHVEAVHIKLAEKERTSVGISSESSSLHAERDDDLNNVITYLRRSKETAETEISLLKQEKLQLQSQLENSLKASESAQAWLHSERASSRYTLFSDEEFKSLKLQLREMNLLRESNMQLREENKHNFEECQKYCQIAQKAKMEIEHLGCLLKEKEIEVDTCRKEIEMKNIKIEQLEHKISELQERHESFDAEDYDHMKQDIQQIKAILREKEASIEEANNLVSEKQQYISSLQQGLANSQLELTEMQKKLSESLQVEATLKSEAEKQKKHVSHFKKKVETLNKEKDELSREKQVLSKQLEDARSSKKPTGETTNEQVLKEKVKEKDTRIQMLERTLEREREEMRKEKEDHRKEKSKRQKTEEIVLDLMQTVRQEKKKLLEELESHKHARDNLLETSGITADQIPSETGFDGQTAAYLLAVDNFDEAVNSVLSGLGAQPVPREISTLVNASPATTGQQALDQALITLPQSSAPAENPSEVKITEEKEKNANLQKSNTEARKVGRKLVRPRLERMQEPSALAEVSGKAASSTSDAKPDASVEVPLGELPLPSNQLFRKRLASSSASELQEESFSQQVPISNAAPLLKKSKGSDSPQEDSKEQPNLLSSEKPPLDSDDSPGHDPLHATNESVDASKDQEIDNASEPSEEPKQPLDVLNEKGLVIDWSTSVEEFMEKPKETVEVLDMFSEIGEVAEQHQSTTDAENEREDGELIPDRTQQEGNDPLSMMDLEPGECHGDPVIGATVDVSDSMGIVSPEALNQEKNDSGEAMEKVAEGLDKSNNNNDQGALESQQTPQASAAEASASASFMAESEERKELQAGRSTTTIDLRERARARAALRQAGHVSPPLARGRGRAFGVLKKDGGRGGRVGRGGRGGRGQSSGDQEQI